MSKYDQLFGETASGTMPESYPIEVGFQCQTCDETAVRAEAYPTEGIILWWCEFGHKSYLEEFYYE